MKKILALTLLAITVSISVFAQQDIKFEAGSFNFGKIAQGTPVTHVFTFKNTGAKPAVVEYCTAECGCTTPEVTKEPILPGKSAKITVHYNTQGRPGPIFKSVFIQSNAQLPEGKDRYEIFIRGTVTQAAPAAAPAK